MAGNILSPGSDGSEDRRTQQFGPTRGAVSRTADWGKSKSLRGNWHKKKSTKRAHLEEAVRNKAYMLLRRE